MDVTTEVNNLILATGGSGTTNPRYASSSRSLNYAKNRNNIHNAANEKITAIPYQLNYTDSVGLFGAENIFIKVQLDIQSASSAFTNITTPENDYMPVWTLAETGTVNFYDTAEIDFTTDTGVINDFEPSTFNNDLSSFRDPYVRIDLSNLKTGNKYVDSWFDVRIYTANREEHESDTIYLGFNDYFYLGFHARNTRRLPYNVKLEIGNEYMEYLDLTDEQRKLTA